MGSILALLVIVLVSLLVVRIGTNALLLTGMSMSAARFQAASAFFGVGFTTSEAEMVMQHDVRRRIVLHLIVAGNIGLTSALATLVVTFVQSGEKGSLSIPWMIGLLLLGGLTIGLFLNLKIIRKPMDALMRRMLQSAGVVRALDYELLLNVQDGYCVSDIMIAEGHPWCGKALWESRPSDLGVVILSVKHGNGDFTGAPNKDQMIKEGDELMVYGSIESVDKAVHMHR